MLDSITFVDLVALSRITPESTVEKFGGLINSSFFDASNILGTLKQNGLVDFVTSFPSQSALTVTEQGKQLLAEAQQNAQAQFDTLDMAILIQLNSGKRNLQDIAGSINVTSKTLAMHLYKLSQQQLLSYELRNGIANMSLTDSGFKRVNEGMPKQEPQQMQSADVQPQQPVQQQAAGQQSQAIQQQPQPQQDVDLQQLEAKILGARKMKGIAMLLIIVIAVIIIAYLYLTHHI